ncbi:MAG: hypothetical protein ACUVXA_17420 [Candidatus Jordarchaeum sp.]|uniref:hypothetical protein n=1 Tax=Candidatus Jordarchaeum sp. TaxID=2823881 RepID=UPI00404B2666
MARAGVIFIGIIALLGAIGGIILGAGITFLGWNFYGNPQADLLHYLYLLADPSTPLWLKNYILLMLLPETLRLMNLATWIGYFGAGVLIVSLIYFATAIGLFAMKNWARIIMIIVGLLYLLGGIGMIIFGILAILNILLIIWGIINLLWGIILVSYLASDVKHDFE